MTVTKGLITESTTAVPPQNRGFPSDYEHQVFLSYPDSTNTGTDSGTMTWKPGRAVEITGLTFCNGDTATAASTDTTVLDVDIEDNAGTKTHDVAALAAAVIAADVAVDLTLSTTKADVQMLSTEIVKVAVAVAGTQGGFGLVVKYVQLDVIDNATTWPAVPAG